METSRQIESAAAAWIARRDAAAWSEADQEGLEAWVAQSIAHRVAFLRLDAAWQQSARLKVLAAGQGADASHEKDELMQSPFSRAQHGDRRAGQGTRAHPASDARGSVDLRDLPIRRRTERPAVPVLRWASIAATILLAVGFVFGLESWTHVDESRYATAVGDLHSFPLADGSSVILNTDSSLSVALSRRERDIGLERGEAFFKVAKDASRPFVVKVGDRKVTAVGTQFSVRRDAAGLRVVVTEGVVRLETASGQLGERVNLPAGSVATVSPAGLSVQTGSLESATGYLSWRSGYLVFVDSTLADAAREFNRYNRSQIVLADAEVAQMRIDGKFRFSNVEAFVRLLQQAFPVQVDRHGDEIVLRSR